MRAGVSGVINEHRAVDQTGVDIVAVVQAPAAAPHRFPGVISLNHSVGQQTVAQIQSVCLYKSPIHLIHLTRGLKKS